MKFLKSKGVRWTGLIAVLIAVVAAIVVSAVWRQRVLPQKTALLKLAKAGAVCLYDYEYDFREEEGRIPNWQIPPAPSWILQFVLGDDWLATPVYVQLAGEQFGDRDIPTLCDALAGLPMVRHVNLRQARVTDESIARLKDLQQLAVIDIRETSITSDGLKSLQGYLPECHILAGRPDSGAGEGGREGLGSQQ
jgi:hypothetical protein